MIDAGLTRRIEGRSRGGRGRISEARDVTSRARALGGLHERTGQSPPGTRFEVDDKRLGTGGGAMTTRRRRFERSASTAAPDPRAALEAEVVLLREENARLKAARNRQHDVEDLLERARSLRAGEIERGNLADETTQMLVEGLVIRESLIEICHEIERAMVVFEARLDALASAADQLVPLQGKLEDDGDGL
jgi:hypothetical protein